MEQEKIYIYALSDSVGETCETLIRAALCHFNFHSYEIKKFSFVHEKNELILILDEARLENSIIFFTLIDTKNVEFIKQFATKYHLPYIDLLTNALNAFQKIFNMEPKREIGMLRKLNNSYFNRIEALEFAVKYDDGKDPRGFADADIILLGISRTGKTPLSLYLANKNYKVANFPLVLNTPIPKELFQIPREKIFVLTIQHDKVKAIRQERLKTLGFGSNSTYSDSDYIFEEILYCEELIRKLGCHTIDITHKAIEETGDIILNFLNK